MKSICFCFSLFFLTSCISHAKVTESCGYDSFLSKNRDVFSIFEPTTVEKAEKHSIESLSAIGVFGKGLIPFGKRNADWLILKRDLQIDDCLIYFKTSKESWKRLSGREGYLLLREGKILYTLITRVS